MVGSDRPSSDSRALDLWLAGVVALGPLLPWGPRYLGYGRIHYTLLGLVALVVTWGLARVVESPPSAAGSATRPGGVVAWMWSAFVVTSTGSLLLALGLETELGSSSFWHLVGELPGRLLRPYHMHAHPFYPVERWLVFAQGALTFVLMRDVCLRGHEPRRRARAVLTGWLCGYAIVAAFAVFQYVTEYQLHPIFVRYSPVVRSHSTLETPNMLASLLLLGLGLTVGMERSWTSTRWRRPVTTGLIVLGLSALGASMSRAAWLALVTVGCLRLGFGPALRPRWARPIARGVMLLVVVIGVAGMLVRVFVPAQPVSPGPATALERVARVFDPRIPLNQVVSYRLDWWRASLDMFGDHPVVGVGLGRYPRLVDAYAAPGVPRENTHSIWLQVLAESGAVGFLSFVALVVAIVGSLVVASRAREPAASALAMGSLLGVAAFLLACTTENQLLLGSAQTALATLMAGTVVASADDTGWEPVRERRRRLARGVACALMTVAALAYPVAMLTR